MAPLLGTSLVGVALLGAAFVWRAVGRSAGAAAGGWDAADERAAADIALLREDLQSLRQHALAVRRQAATSERTHDAFLAMLGHEMRNPLGGISAAVEVLNRVAGDSEAAASARAVITRQTRRLARVTNDFLERAQAMPADAASGFAAAPPTLPHDEVAGEPVACRCAVQPRRIGLIEDNDDAGPALRMLLEIDGHSVWLASDGAGGLRRLLDTWPDVALVDIGLPGLDGRQIARRSREAGYAGLMVAISGLGQAADVAASRAAGFDHHLVKPVDIQRLHELIAQAPCLSFNGR
jgi:CheY-like chemotaxis protein